MGFKAGRVLAAAGRHCLQEFDGRGVVRSRLCDRWQGGRNLGPMPCFIFVKMLNAERKYGAVACILLRLLSAAVGFGQRTARF